MKIVKHFFIVIDRVLDALSILLLVFTTIVVLLAVYSRYIIVSPIPWTEEIGRNGFIWLSFLGIALAERFNMHFSITYFIGKTSGPVQRWIGIATEILILYAMVVVLQEGFRYVQQGKAQLSPILEWQESIVYVALPVSVLLTLYYRLKRVIPLYIQSFRGEKEG